MALIGLGKIEKKMLPILLASIFCFLNRLLHNCNCSELFKNTLLTNISISGSKIFALIPLFIIKFKFSHKHVTDKEIQIKKNQSVEYLYTDEKAFILKDKWLYILLSVIIFFFNQLLFVVTFEVQSNTSILNILFSSIFYYFIFKIKLFRHHYLSIAFITIIGLVIDLILDNLQEDITERIELFLLRILREILYSLSSVVDKYIMESKFVSLYIIMICHGVFSFVLFIIIALFDHYYHLFPIHNYPEYFNAFDFKELLVLFGVLITQFGLNLFLLVTNKNYSPCHLCIIFIFGQLAYYVDDITEKKNIIVIICLILILFFSLTFNEIILLNFWGLSKNTKGNIIKRAENENDYINKVYTIESINSKAIQLTDKEDKEDKEEKVNELDETQVYQ